MNFTEHELERYTRHISLPEIGLEGQKRLKGAKVLCVGIGGLGSPVSIYLAAAGVGTIGLIDADVVEITNLQRQILYTESDQKIKKTQAASDRLHSLNSSINIKTYDAMLTAENANEICSQYDIIADCSDNFNTRALINETCWQLHKPDVYAAIYQFEGQCSIFGTEGGPCYRCLFTDSPPENLEIDFARAGLLGVLPGVMGTIQATEILKLILNIGDPLIGRLLTYDLLNMQFHELKIPKDLNCGLCQKTT